MKQQKHKTMKQQLETQNNETTAKHKTMKHKTMKQQLETQNNETTARNTKQWNNN